MRNKFNILLASSILAIGGMSCNETAWDDEIIASGQGSLDLQSITIDLNKTETVVTRAADVNDFLVTVTDLNSDEVRGSWKYSEMPEIISLPVGDNYQLSVESHKINDAEWDNPYYAGSQTFSITKGKITRIGDVTASFASLKVTINFTDELKKSLGEDVEVTVIGNNGAELVYKPTETRAGYFAIGDASTFAAHFSGTVDGVFSTSEIAFKDVKPGQHHILTYGVKEGPEIPEQSGQVDNGGINFDVTYEVDDMESNSTIEEDIMGDSDRPGQEGEPEPDDPEDPNTPDTPDNPDNPEETYGVTFEAMDSPKLDLEGINEVKPDEPFGNAIVFITSENGVKEFWLEVTTDNETLAGLLDGMGLLNCDMLNPGKAEADLRDFIKLPYGDQIRDKKEVKFDITQFVPVLSGFEGNHSFTMKVMDSGYDKYRNTSLRFKVDKVAE